MLWDVNCSTDWTNQTQVLLKDQFLRSMFKFVLPPKGLLPGVSFSVTLQKTSPSMVLPVFPIHLPISSQWLFITTSTVFESALMFKHLHTLLQMKSTPSVRDSAFSVLRPASPPGQKFLSLGPEAGGKDNGTFFSEWHSCFKSWTPMEGE